MRLAPEMRETIARATHEAYRADHASRKPADDPALLPWDQLPAHLQESNRRQADGIFDQLRRIGCTVHQAGDGGVRLLELVDDEVEEMAQREHARWEAERKEDGWTRGERDVLAKTSPYIDVDWEKLPEDVREWDREVVRRIPELLAGVGLEIKRE